MRSSRPATALAEHDLARGRRRAVVRLRQERRPERGSADPVSGPSFADEIAVRRKRAGHLLSKGRYLAAQLLAMLDGDLWLDNARAANSAAQRLADAAPERLVYPVEANEVFLRVSAKRRHGFAAWASTSTNGAPARSVSSPAGTSRARRRPSRFGDRGSVNERHKRSYTSNAALIGESTQPAINPSDEAAHLMPEDVLPSGPPGGHLRPSSCRSSSSQSSGDRRGSSSAASSASCRRNGRSPTAS